MLELSVTDYVDMIKTSKLSFAKQRALLAEMIRTDFKLRYQASALGYLWSILKPLFLFAILYTVFARFLRLGSGVPNYALSLLLGIVLWNFFAEATGGSLKSVVAKGNLIRKVDIPRHLIPIASTASAFINMLLNLTVVFIFVIFNSGAAVSWVTFIIFPLLVIELGLFTLGVGYFLAAVYVKFRDIDYIWEVGRQALFYVVPIIYPLTMIPYEIIQKIIIMNPIAQVIQDARSVITYSGTIGVESIYGGFTVMHLLPFLITGLVFITGVLYFNSKSRYFAENV